MKPMAGEWVAKAEGDFVCVRREWRARRNPNYDALCFHAQQCAEKYMPSPFATLANRRLVKMPIRPSCYAPLFAITFAPNWHSRKEVRAQKAQHES